MAMPWFRFPYGDYNAHAISVVNSAGFVPVGWTVDTLGWEGTSGGITAQTVLNRVLGSLRPGEIVLMHCGSNPDDHSTLDAAALPSVIQALQARGYSFVTLDALRTPGNWGDEVNPFGNGFDVLRPAPGGEHGHRRLDRDQSRPGDPLHPASPGRSRVRTGSTTRRTAWRPGCPWRTPAMTRRAPG